MKYQVCIFPSCIFSFSFHLRVVNESKGRVIWFWSHRMSIRFSIYWINYLFRQLLEAWSLWGTKNVLVYTSRHSSAINFSKKLKHWANPNWNECLRRDRSELAKIAKILGFYSKRFIIPIFYSLQTKKTFKISSLIKIIWSINYFWFCYLFFPRKFGTFGLLVSKSTHSGPILVTLTKIEHLIINIKNTKSKSLTTYYKIIRKLVCITPIVLSL